MQKALLEPDNIHPRFLSSFQRSLGTNQQILIVGKDCHIRKVYCYQERPPLALFLQPTCPGSALGGGTTLMATKQGASLFPWGQVPVRRGWAITKDATREEDEGEQLLSQTHQTAEAGGTFGSICPDPCSSRAACPGPRCSLGKPGQHKGTPCRLPCFGAPLVAKGAGGHPRAGSTQWPLEQLSLLEAAQGARTEPLITLCSPWAARPGWPRQAQALCSAAG